MRCCSLVSLLGFTSLLAFSSAQQASHITTTNNTKVKKHHHHKHHHHHGHHHGKHQGHHQAREDPAPANATKASHEAPAKTNSTNSTNSTAAATPVSTHAPSASERQIVKKIQKLEQELTSKADARESPKTRTIAVGTTDITAPKTGKLEVNAPLPKNFAELFARATSEATGVDSKEVQLVSSSSRAKGKIAAIVFRAPGDVVKAVQHQAANPESKLAMGPLCAFLVARDEEGSITAQCGAGAVQALAAEPAEAAEAESQEPKEAEKEESKEPKEESKEPNEPQEAQEPEAPVQDKGIDIDTSMPYGQLEPFGREDTAQELTESSIRESDGMVDQLERAEVAEEKRAIFRALTRLRGAAITSFDGIARTQTGNIDRYNKVNKWRDSHPLRHLANEESDISKWAFPDANL